MKTLVTGAVIVLCLAVSACAGTGGRNGFAKGTSLDDDIDYAKVIAVNEWATRRQATVVWLNYPKKPVRAHTDG